MVGDLPTGVLAGGVSYDREAARAYVDRIRYGRSCCYPALPAPQNPGRPGGSSRSSPLLVGLAIEECATLWNSSLESPSLTPSRSHHLRGRHRRHRRERLAVSGGHEGFTEVG